MRLEKGGDEEWDCSSAGNAEGRGNESQAQPTLIRKGEQKRY